jgi:hypothetical protein
MTGFEATYGIVELMGRNRIAGMISEVTIAGAAFLRVDVPEVNGNQGFTKYYGGSSIYAITPTDETTAVHAASRLKERPVEKWVVPDRLRLPEPDGIEFTSDNLYEEYEDDDEL